MTRVPVEERREQLIAAAIDVICDEGVAGASLRAIAARAGTSLASVHYAFASRLALLQATIEHLIDASARSVADLEAPPEVPPRALIEAHLRAYLADVQAHRNRELGLLELTLTAVRDPSLSPLPAELYGQFYAAATGIAEAFAKQLGTPWTVPVRRVARTIVMITDGLVLSWLATDDAEVAEDLIAAGTDTLAALLGAGDGDGRPA
ncbi:TetR/AcrR family transcriptional regulator [Tersicoccus sp. MR15.9]|uniref:TetR/AcrR family transcriptional regulator n=1 Tax=Tersicoccus mangrovi TaxID=3121635 RepID=UPI002FE5B404